MSLYDICWKHKISVLDIVTEVIEERKAGILPKHTIKIQNRAKVYKTYDPEKNLRICSQCRKPIEWTPENFFYQNKKTGELSTFCKPCKLELNRFYYNFKKGKCK